jgi:hypothetical protein
MIQATNELILGIELNEEYSQLTYFHSSVREPLTFGAGQETDKFLMPMALRQDCHGIWHFREDASEDQKTDRACIDDLYRKLSKGEPVKSRGTTFQPSELLAAYFGLWLEKLKLLAQNAQIHVMVTVRELTEEWSRLLVEALEHNGIARRRIYLQDYLSSFYYYTINQKKELWYQDVALLEYENEAIVGYVLHIDRTTKPAIARVDRVARQPMNDSVRAGRSEQEWKKEKDRLFFELLKKVFERRTISVSYLMGDYFSKSWAERSIQYLCYKRHAFQGRNLYSKGACFAAMERAGLIAGRDMIFGGRDMIERNIGMEMRIRGKESFYPMVSAGINWYEAYHVCEFILNDEREIRLISHPMAQGDPIVHTMRLPGLPSRPNRSTRIRLTVYFTAPGICHIEAEDLGFGGLFKASGLTWSRTIRF